MLRADTGRVISQMGRWTDLTNRGRRTMRAWIVSQALDSECRDLALLSQCASPINSACEAAITAVPAGAAVWSGAHGAAAQLGLNGTTLDQ